MSSIPCNQNVLSQMTALAGMIQNPIPPAPIFFDSSNCAAGGSVSSASFPQYFFPSDCSSSGIPLPSDNCLRVINGTDGSFDPLGDTGIPAQFVNQLPIKGGTIGNIFSDPTQILFSFYCPPQYMMVFYNGNPTLPNTKKSAAATGYLMVPPNFTFANTCEQLVTLNNGAPFLGYNPSTGGTATIGNCRESWCGAALHKSSDTVPLGDYCTIPGANYQTWPSLFHNAPYFVVVKTTDFSQIIYNMCVKNTSYYLGIGDTDNLLNTVWSPQSTACDNFITNLCNTSDLTASPYVETCACFTQQAALNNQYGANLNVPVLCFGQDSTGNSKKDCYNNPNAYKTSKMAMYGCSFAQCQTVVNNSPGIQARASPPGTIECQGNFVNFPVVPQPAMSALPIYLHDISSNIPFYAWLMLGFGVFFLFLFIFALAFV